MADGDVASVAGVRAPKGLQVAGVPKRQVASQLAWTALRQARGRAARVSARVVSGGQ